MSKTPGRKPQYSSFRKRQLSSEAKIIIELIKNQPLTKDELCQNTKLNIRTFYRINSFLLEQKIIKPIDGMYALWNFDPLEKQIENALIKLQKKTAFIGTSMISNEMGIPWPEIETVTCKVAKKLGLTKGTTDGIHTSFYNTSKEKPSK
jgi:hypothetical protein